jgi:hypothetical protein
MFALILSPSLFLSYFHSFILISFWLNACAQARCVLVRRREKGRREEGISRGEGRGRVGEGGWVLRFRGFVVLVFF